MCSAFVEMNELRTPKKIYIREEIVQLDPKGLKKKKNRRKNLPDGDRNVVDGVDNMKDQLGNME